MRSVILDLLAAAELPAGSSVLHLGRASGPTSSAIAAKGLFVHSIDPSAAGPVEAREPRQREADDSSNDEMFGRQSVEDLQLCEQAYDCVIATDVIERAAWDRLLLRKCFCVLRPGGFLIAAVPNQASLSLRSVTDAPAPGEPEEPRERLYAPRDFDQMLGRIGFDIVRAESHGLERLRIGPLNMPSAMTQAVERGIERANRSARPSILRERGDQYVVLASKPPGSGVAACLKGNAALRRGIEGFEESHQSETRRLAEWQTTFGEQWGALPGAHIEQIIREARSAVVLSPHPDDELIGCGGLLLELIAGGVKVHIVQLTDGAESEALRDADEPRRRTVRVVEARRVAEAMGVDRLTCLNAPNGHLNAFAPYVEPVQRLLRESPPDLVFVPFVNDRHPDHVAANLLLDSALRGLSGMGSPLVLAYEVGWPVPPHYVHPTDSFVQLKLDLLMMYPTPMCVVDYIWHCQVRDGHHSRRHLGREGYAEAYLAMECGLFHRLIEAHRSVSAL